MDEIDSLINDDNLSVHLDSLLGSKLSCKDVDSITSDWTFLDDIEITPDKYVAYSPVACDFIHDTCTRSSNTEQQANSTQVFEYDVFNGSSTCKGQTSTKEVFKDNPSSVSSESSVNSDCKNDCTENDTQYDSGVGESLSGGEDTDLNTSNNSTQFTQEESNTDNNNNTDEKGRRRSTRNKNNANKEYNLRTTSVINRIETDRRRKTPKQPKPKTRPPPLSKYRRKTANARERTRMEEINQGFDLLHNVIPHIPKSKLTKITTLRLAINYIRALREMLGYEEDISNISPLEVIANE